ncbi:hypothetical protein [Streptomyces sp. ISL-99]|uniref:hypothetical protein n=1 Tax=Streptomyces sp. ISL-99 TaxID=2819193 RepID=UPI002034B930|nr:hypothetical protein [Streptomyces sp. ISL-99]
MNAAEERERGNRPPGETEYRALLAHTADCPTCLDGCPTGDRLRQAEREARR